MIQEKNWREAEIYRQFRDKGWKVRTVNKAIKRLVDTGSIYRRPGSGKPCEATNDDNTEMIERMAQSQEDQPGSHLSQRQIARQLHVSASSVNRMVKTEW